MLKEFRALPTEARAREMKDRDYLWCLVHQLLDREEELEQLCPACRQRAEHAGCPSCGQPIDRVQEGAVNPNFDADRFERLKEGGQA